MRDVREGTILAGRYVVSHRIYAGQNSYIYLASDLRLPGKVWAIKQWLSDHRASGGYGHLGEQRLLTLIKILSNISHPNLINVVDYFEEKGFRYVVMDFVDGCTLFELLYRYPEGQFLPESRVIAWAIQICRACHYLHTLPYPVLVLDIKPENIMLTPDGIIKLIDFGLARFFNPSEPRPVEYGVGTPGYAPPEQIEGKPCDVRADIYAIGATMFHLLTKRKPLEFQAPLPPVKELNPTVSDHIVHVIRTATQPEPTKRYSSVSELLNDLTQTLAGDPVEAEKHFVKGLTFSKEGALQRAMEEFYQAVLLAPNARHLQALGHVLFDLGKYGEAEQIYEAAISQLGGDDPRAYKNLGVYMLRSRRYEEALVLLEKAFSRLPDDPDICHELGVAYYSNGYFFKAAMLLERAVRLGFSNNPVTLKSLGDAYWALGDWSEALEMHTRAQVLSQSSDYSDLIQRDSQLNSLSEKYREALIAYQKTGQEDVDSLIDACRAYAEALRKEGKALKGSTFAPGFRVLAQLRFERAATVLETVIETIKANCLDRMLWLQLVDTYKELGELSGNAFWLEKGIQILEGRMAFDKDDNQLRQLLDHFYQLTEQVDKAVCLRVDRFAKGKRNIDELIQVKGIEKVSATKLYRRGITTLPRLAAMDPEHLANILGISKARAATILQSARALIKESSGF